MLIAMSKSMTIAMIKSKEISIFFFTSIERSIKNYN